MNNGRIVVSSHEQISVTKFEYVKRGNEFCQAIVNGDVSEADYESCKASLTAGGVVVVEEITDGRSDVCFSGVIKNVTINCDGGYRVSMLLQGVASCMDAVPRTRVFQDSQNSVASVLDVVLGNYNLNYVMGAKSNLSIDHMIVQYEETDWEFALRILAEAGGMMLPNCGSKPNCFLTSVNPSGGTSIDTDEYAVNCHYGEYERNKENGLAVRNEDQLEYVVRGSWHLELGDAVCFNGINTYVYSAEGKWEGEELIHYYGLRSEGAFQTVPKLNKKITGVTFNASVSAVNHDKIKVDYLDVEAHGDRQYDYATVYSSSSGAGWYCMPETGDTVMITIADPFAREAYATGAVHLSKGSKDPDTKFIRNPHDKEIRFTKDSLTITNNNGTEIILSDKDGLTLRSAESIKFIAEKDILITSETERITIQGEQGVELERGSSKVLVDENVSLVGEQVHVQKAE